MDTLCAAPDESKPSFMQGWLQLTGKSICTASKHCAIRNYVISKKKIESTYVYRSS